MSRILLVEPIKMLQYAFAVALFPEHPVQVLDKIPEAETMAEVDLVIIDAGALRERDLMPAREVWAAQNWQAPVLWVDVGASDFLSKNSTRLSVPLKREELRTAVAENLRRFSRSEASAERSANRSGATVAAKPKIAQPSGDRVVAKQDKPLIELVDVIEETPGLEDVEAGNKT